MDKVFNVPIAAASQVSVSHYLTNGNDVQNFGSSVVSPAFRARVHFASALLKSHFCARLKFCHGLHYARKAFCKVTRA
jgi:hypothetical protein